MCVYGQVVNKKRARLGLILKRALSGFSAWARERMTPRSKDFPPLLLDDCRIGRVKNTDHVNAREQTRLTQHPCIATSLASGPLTKHRRPALPQTLAAACAQQIHGSSSIASTRYVAEGPARSSSRRRAGRVRGSRFSVGPWRIISPRWARAFRFKEVPETLFPPPGPLRDRD